MLALDPIEVTNAHLEQLAHQVSCLSALTCLRFGAELSKVLGTDGGQKLLQAVTQVTGRDARCMIAPNDTEEFRERCCRLGVSSAG